MATVHDPDVKDGAAVKRGCRSRLGIHDAELHLKVLVL